MDSVKAEEDERNVTPLVSIPPTAIPPPTTATTTTSRVTEVGTGYASRDAVDAAAAVLADGRSNRAEALVAAAVAAGLPEQALLRRHKRKRKRDRLAGVVSFTHAASCRQTAHQTRWNS